MRTEIILRGGGPWESNPPKTSRPPTGFEDRGPHQRTLPSICILAFLSGAETVASGCRPPVFLALPTCPTATRDARWPLRLGSQQKKGGAFRHRPLLLSPIPG